MPQNEILYNDFNSFLKELKSLKIDKIAFSHISELRNRQKTKEICELFHLDKLDILAYKNGIIHKLQVIDPDLEGLKKEFNDADIEVKILNNNIV